MGNDKRYQYWERHSKTYLYESIWDLVRSDCQLIVTMIQKELSWTYTTVRQIQDQWIGAEKSLHKNGSKKFFRKTKRTLEGKGAVTFWNQLKVIFISWNVTRPKN